MTIMFAKLKGNSPILESLNFLEFKYHLVLC